MKRVLKNSLVLSLLFGVGLTYGCFFEDSQKEAKRLYESGLNALDEKRKDEAISYFQEAVEKDPDHAKAHCRLGQLYRDANHLVLAEREFSAALREDPGLVEARRSLAWLLYQREAYEEAIPFFRELLVGGDKDPDIRLALSHSLLGAGDAGEAREMAEKTAADFPDDVLVQIGLARFYERASLYSLAEDTLFKIRDDFPDTPQAHIALMAFYMRRGRLDEAEAVGTGAVTGGLADKGLHQRLFVLENRRENYETALRHLEAAAAMSPDDPDLWMLLGDYHLFLKLYPQARDVYEKIAAKWPASTGAQTRIAEVYMAEGRYDKAISTIEGVLVEAPDHPHARLLRGLLWIREGETDKARTEIVKALEADPISAEGYYLYGLSFLKEGDYESSLPQILRAVEMEPDSLKARLALAYVYSKMGHFFLSLNELDQILAARPEHPRARALRARVRIRLRDYEGAAFDYQYLIDNGLSTPEMPFHLADIHRAQGRLDQALNVVSRGLAKDPDSRKGLKTKVRILIAQGAYEQAVDVCNGYLKKRPDDLEFGILKAGILLKQKKYGDAENLLTRLIKQHPRSYSPVMLMAKALRTQRKFSQALIYYRQAVERDPEAIEAHMEMAEAYVLVGQFDKAIDAYEAVLTIDGTYGPALNDLAYLYAERDQNLDRALSLALRAFEQMPENPAVRDTLGWAYLKKGSVLLGKTHLAEAVRLGSKNPLFHYHLGIALHESDDLPGARKAFSEAIRLGLEGKELAAARNRMQQITAKGVT